MLRSTTPAQDGGKSSNIKEATLSTLETERFLMFTKERISKAKKLLSGQDTTEPTRDGEFLILTNTEKKELRATTVTLVSISADHSTSDLECQ